MITTTVTSKEKVTDRVTDANRGDNTDRVAKTDNVGITIAAALGWSVALITVIIVIVAVCIRKHRKR